MKKVKNLYTVGVLSFAMFFVNACSDIVNADNENHTLNFHYQYDAPTQDDATTQDNQDFTTTTTTTTTILNKIFYDETSDSYFGEFNAISSTYDKSSVLVGHFEADESSDQMLIEYRINSDSSGDMSRVKLVFDTSADVKNLTGKNIARDTTVDVAYQVELANVKNVDIYLQTRYDSKKGGSKTDFVKFNNFKVSFITKQDDLPLDVCEDVSADEVVPEQSSSNKQDLTTQDLTIEGLLDTSDVDNRQNLSDLTTDKTTESNSVADVDIADLTADNQQNLLDLTTDKSAEPSATTTTTTTTTIAKFTVNYDLTSDFYYGGFNGLTSSYKSSSLFIAERIIDLSTDKMTIDYQIKSDATGDMCRISIEFCSDETVDTKNLTGKNLVKDETVDINYVVDLPADVKTVKVYLQVQYVTKKGGSKTDKLNFYNLKIRQTDSD